MKQHCVLSALWESFYSKELYNNVADFWRGRTFGLNALLTLIYTIIIAVGIHFALQTMKESENLKQIISQIPEIKIENGIAKTPEARLYPILDQNQRLIALVDTTSTEVPVSISEDTHFYLNQTKVVVRKSSTETRIYDLKSLDTMEINSTIATEWVKIVANWGSLIIAPFIFMGVFLWRLIETLLFSLATLLFLKLKKIELDYSATYALTMVAITPAFLIGALIDSLLPVPFISLGLVFIRLGYIYYSVQSLEETTH
jgi:hypothetical protein